MSAQNPNSTESQQTPEQILMTIKIIWAFLLMSIFIYGFVASQKAQTGFVFDVSQAMPQNQFQQTVSVMAVLVVALSYLIPKFLIKAVKKQITPQSELRQILNLFFAPFIIRLAMLEACTIFGLVLSFTSGSVMIMLPFALVTVIGFLLNFPSETYIRSAMQGANSGPEII